VIWNLRFGSPGFDGFTDAASNSVGTPRIFSMPGAFGVGMRFTLSITSTSVMVVKVATPTALPDTSCAQVTTADGVTPKVCDIRRRSRVSCGRSINRCGPRLTG
jgi:hypothetical protein